jgi:hypothetical protein
MAAPTAAAGLQRPTAAAILLATASQWATAAASLSSWPAAAACDWPAASRQSLWDAATWTSEWWPTSNGKFLSFFANLISFLCILISVPMPITSSYQKLEPKYSFQKKKI